MLLGVQLATLLGVSLQILLDDEQLTTTPWSPACVSTARQFSVLRLEDARINQYLQEVQDWVVHGLRGHGVDVNTPMWPSCLHQPRNHPASCIGRMCVTTFTCSSDTNVTEDTMRMVQAGHDTSVIIFNLEIIMDAQLRPCFADPRFEPMWRQAVVWDYSSENVASLARLGLSPPAGHPHPARPAVVNLTYYPGISGDPAKDDSPPRFERFHEPYDYDVVLLMGLTERREVIWNALQQRNLTVYCPNNVGPGAWGADRAALVRRSAVLLNVHQFDAALTEAPRLFFLLSLGATVLSEETTDPEARAYWAGGVEFVPYDQLADAAVRLVANATRRYELAMAGYQLVRRASPRDSIRDPLVAALDWTNTPYSLQECPTVPTPPPSPLPPSSSPSTSSTPTPSPSPATLESPSPSPSPSSSPSPSPSPLLSISAASPVAKLTPLALAIVGPNLTEWTHLQRMPRHVVDQVIYKPHAEMGYYNLLDFEHRRFMRVLADHFGVHGFCFYHFWVKDQPVLLNRPVELMIKDGEPKKPFLLCWANEQHETGAWDGSASDDLLHEQQDYSDREGNIKHFNYLLPMLRHKRYIHINNRPVFFFYRIGPTNAEAIGAVMALWQELAVEAGLPGIHFMRFTGPFPWADTPGVQGFAQFEPGFSTMHSSQITTLREVDGPYAGFRLFDAETTWAAAAQRGDSLVAGVQQFHRGTFARWNNAPRHNWTNGNRDSYPSIYRNATVAGFERHLRRVCELAANDGATITGPEHFVFLTSWNQWNEQSALEPNDVDAYDNLAAVKRVFKPHTGKTVVHLCHPYGGTESYMRDLWRVFAEYNHTWIQDGKPPPPSKDCALLHIQSAMVAQGPRWGLLDIVHTYRQKSIPVYLTIHDYQWLFEDPGPELEVLQTVEPEPGRVKNTTELFKAVHRVIFPERTVYEYYRAKIGDKRWNEDKIVLAPHNDLIVHSDRFFVAPVADNTINIAFVGRLAPYKGGGLFRDLSYSPVLSEKHPPLTFRFHQFGELHHSIPKDNCTAIEFNGWYDDQKIEAILREKKIHIVTFLSLFPETYSYVLTRLLRAGIPLVYLNRGALIDRLAGVKHAFAIEEATLASLEAGVSRAVEFVMQHRQGTDTILRELSANVQPTKWYLLNYPEVAQ